MYKNTILYHISFILIVFFNIEHTLAQSVKGTVLNDNLIQINGAVVVIDSQYSTVANEQGIFSFNSISSGKYPITVSAVGYEKYSDTITLQNGQHLDLEIMLYNEGNMLSELVIVSESAIEKVRNQPVRAVVVEIREVAEQPVTLAELINRSPGVRVRQNGGLGNNVDISVNGFQGNSVQYFRDGIPLEYLGGGYGINNVTINLLERVEIYKGVIPVSLGGDALGGAVDLITNRKDGSVLDLSYEHASFNTHITNLSAYHSNNDWFAGTDAFFNYSDNNYTAQVEVVNENSNLKPENVRLFHNGYKHYFVEGYAGLRNKTWTDELKFSLAHYAIDSESQHPALMTNPYGALMVHNRGWIPSIRYKKSIGNFNIDHFTSYSSINRSRVDTIQGTFNWYGEFTPGTTIGESPRPSLSDIDFDNIISRTNLSYIINENNKLEGNFVYNHSKRLGADPYGLRFLGTDIDVLSKEATYAKTIAGISWESKWFDHKLVNQLTGKYFSFKSKGINGFMANALDLNNYVTSSDNNFGISNATKYTINDHQLLRMSFELTNRLPRENELFGDNDTRAPNFELKPERSFNLNLAYRYETEKLSAEISGFYRKTEGMILLVPVQAPFSQYQNLDNIRGYGFDLDLNYSINEFINLYANSSWQDNRMTDITGEVYKWIEGTRLRNTPYFFANAGITGNLNNLINDKDRLKLYFHWNFIREFYLNHIPKDKEPGGFLGLFGNASIPVTNVVPNQHLLTTGFNYFFASQPISIGFEIKNLANEKLYDYYKVQRPGRSFHIKINYRLENKKG